MKKCTICGQEKSLEDFYASQTGKHGKHSWCKPCFREYQNRLYREKYDEKRKSQNYHAMKRRHEGAKKLRKYLQAHPCVDCGESNPIVLDFDHRDPSIKTSNVPRLTRYSWKRVIEELKKCDVRCSNCHRVRTAKQLGYYKGEYDD